MNTSHMRRNGLITFGFHSEDKASQIPRSWLVNLIEALRSDKPKEVNQWLKVLLERPPLRNFVPPEVSVAESEFESIDTQNKSFTHTLKYKFRQKYQDIPVYGSQVTVELDEDDREFIAINSAIGGQIDTNASPKLKPDEVKAKIWEKTGNDLRDNDLTPNLYYYFDSRKNYWRLVYIVENRPKKTEKLQHSEKSTYELVDYVIDAHNGELVSKLPRMRTVQKETE